MYRVAIITQKGDIISENFATRDEVDEFLVLIDDSDGIKKFRVLDKDTNEIVETESGRRDKHES
jgi:hypothetical protein